MVSIEAAIAIGKVLGKMSLYFGCWQRPGHYLHNKHGSRIYNPKSEVDGFPWSENLLDAGLLKNGKRPDVYDGKVFWTCGGSPFWYAFFWWDNSVDHRGMSNSGLYVRGFGWPEVQEAFDYACAEFPSIVTRQRHKLIVQDVEKCKKER
jgi:hypothetical protein